MCIPLLPIIKSYINEVEDYYIIGNYSPLTLCDAAALTSASQSLSNPWKAGTKSVFVISGPTAFCN